MASCERSIMFVPCAVRAWGVNIGVIYLFTTGIRYTEPTRSTAIFVSSLQTMTVTRRFGLSA